MEDANRSWTASDADVRRFVEEMVRRFHPWKVVLFGSHACGAQGPDSDVDLLVVMDFEGRSVDQAARIGTALARKFPLDLIVRRPEDLEARLAAGDSFLREIVERGKVLYARHAA